MKNFFGVPEQTCPQQTASIFLREKKTVVFLTHPTTVAVCVYMLSIPPVPTGKSCPVCVCLSHLRVCVWAHCTMPSQTAVFT